MANIKTTLFALIVSIPIGVSFSEQARAQAQCGERSAMVGELKTRYAEKAVGEGVSIYGEKFELFASDKGTWSILVTKHGKACLAAHGNRWIGKKGVNT